MSLKRKITKAEHTALNALLQAEYKAEGDEFVLDAVGYDDPAELKRAKDREVEARKVAEAKATAAETELRTLKEGTARASGDIVALETSWKQKNTDLTAAHAIELAKRDKHLQATLVDSVANQLAAEIGGPNAALLMPHIKSRLTADLSGDSPLTRVLDKAGKPSAASVEDLKKEIAGDAQFKAVVIASKGSGGGAAGIIPTAGGGAAPSGKKFNELNDAERKEWYGRDPQGFVAASDANKVALLNRPAVVHTI